jgi:hypothetical protein
VDTHRIPPSRRPLLGLAAAICVVVSAAGAAPPPSREDAARLRVKVEAIERNGLAKRPAALATRVSEREVNAYLAFDAKSDLPAGFTDPRITVLPDLKLSGTATIDLDAIRKERQSRSWLDPLTYMGGKVAVAVSGRLTSSNGLARFALERAVVGGITVPKMLVQELVTFYSRTPGNPRGLNLDDPYTLPARIRQIDIQPGEAIVRQ